MVPIPCSIISHIAIALLILSPPDSSRFVAAQQPDVAPYPTNPGPYTGLIFLIFATVVIITAFLYYFIRERHRNTVGGTNSPFTRDTPAATAGFFSFLPPPRGVDPSVLATFPVYTHSEVKGLKAITTGEGEAAAPLECAVCLNAFQGDETLRLLPRCGHVFHLSCLDPWLAAHTTCPYCRAGLTDGPGPAGAGAGAGESTHVAVTVAVRSR